LSTSNVPQKPISFHCSRRTRKLPLCLNKNPSRSLASCPIETIVLSQRDIPETLRTIIKSRIQCDAKISNFAVCRDNKGQLFHPVIFSCSFPISAPGCRMGVAVGVNVGVAVEAGVSVCPHSCPGPQLDNPKPIDRTSIAIIRNFVFIATPLLSPMRGVVKQPRFGSGQEPERRQLNSAASTEGACQTGNDHYQCKDDPNHRPGAAGLLLVTLDYLISITGLDQFTIGRTDNSTLYFFAEATRA